MGKNSSSTKLSTAIIDKLKTIHTTANVQEVTLTDFPHLSEEFINAYSIEKKDQSAAETEILRLSDNALEEIFWADTIVIGLPMYNFGIPSALKAWIDQYCQTWTYFYIQ